jgi:gamma-glutamylcyclotransferase (GGCT)/AIG2-like uncharacterized protein YtfP
MNPEDPFLLFVYGTLMRGGPRHRTLAGQRFLGAARTLPRYALFDLGAYPGLIHDAGGQAIHGELYEVEAALIPLLDRVEGAPELYRLGPVALEGCDRPVYAYFYQQSTLGYSPCEGNRWENVRRRRDPRP